MAVNADGSAQAHGIRQALGYAAGSPIHAKTLTEAALSAAGLNVRRLPIESPLLESHLALRKRGQTAVSLRDDLSPAESHFAIAVLLAGMALHPSDDAWFYDGEEAMRDPAAIDSVLKVDAATPDQHRSALIRNTAAELLFPAQAAVQAYQSGKHATEIAQELEIPTAIALSRLIKHILAGPQISDVAEAKPSKDWSLRDLDPSQRDAASAMRGPILVGAGPGTGKTRTLVARVVHLVQDMGVQPCRILALTYNRAAAAQMQEQIDAALCSVGDHSFPERPWVGTLHSFGMELIRRYHAQMGYAQIPALIDSLGSVDLLESHLDECGLDLLLDLHHPAPTLAAITGRISRAKDELCDPARYAGLTAAMLESAERSADEDGLMVAQKCAEIGRCYAAYERLKRQHGVVDYGDLIALPVRLLEDSPDIRRELAAQFPHILADEYQDVNRASARMLQLLAGSGAGLWVVGDHRQSIYRFRGASPANIQAFHNDFPHGRRIDLAVNYRSVRPIVECFSALAASPQFKGSESLREDGVITSWRAHRQEAHGRAIELLEASSDEAQNAAIAEWIAQELANGRSPNEIAVLCRTNLQAERVAAALESAQIDADFLRDPMAAPEVLDILALAEFCAGQMLPAIGRIRRMSRYPFADATVDELVRRRAFQTPAEPEPFAEEDPIATEQAGDASAHAGAVQLLQSSEDIAAQRLLQDYEILSPLADRPALLLASILFDLPSVQASNGLGKEQRAVLQNLPALRHLLALASAFDTRPDLHGRRLANRTLDFLASLRRMLGAGLAPRLSDHFQAAPSHVRVMTIHAAKGLEFPVTLLPYLSKAGFHARGPGDGLADPPGLAEPDEEGMEERSLFFVGLSRAKDKLVLAFTSGDNDKPLPLAPVLQELLPWLTERTVPRSRIKRIISGAHDAGPVPVGPLGGAKLTGRAPVFTEAALATYLRCPHQYYLRYVENLSGAMPKSAYQKLYAAVWQTLSWMRASWASGEIAELGDILARLDELWAQHGPVGARGEAAYLERARRMVANAFTIGTGGLAPLDQLRLETELAGARVKIAPDAAFESADGQRLRLVRYKTGRQGKDDHTDKRLALLRHAAQPIGKDIEIELHYLQSGETRPVPPSTRYEPQRVEKYTRAVQAILAARFDTAPGHECRTCPFQLICER